MLLSKANILGMPQIDPMLPFTAKEPFNDGKWLFEVKWDGYRCLAYLTNEKVYLRSRNAKPLLPQFPVLSVLKSSLKSRRLKRAILDGEIVAFRGGKVDFSYLRTHPRTVVFVAFDLIYLDNRDLLDVPLYRRRKLLEESFDWGKNLLYYSKAVEGSGATMFSWIREHQLEGMMAKRIDSLYFPGKRTKDWLKIRNIRESEFWVVGFTPAVGRLLGSLVLAVREKDGYKIVGKVSSGINEQVERTLLSLLGSPIRKPDFKVTGRLTKTEVGRILWVRPYFGVTVQYTEMTPDGKLRHPVFREVTKLDGSVKKQ